MSDRQIDQLTAHYVETLRLIQETVVADLPRWAPRPKPWDHARLVEVAERLRDANLLALRAYTRDTLIPAVEVATGKRKAA